MQDILTSERLILRTLEDSDAEKFSEYVNDWDIARMTGSIPFPFPIMSAEIKILMMQSQKRRRMAYPYAITLDGGEMIGVMDLFRRNEEDDLELGYWVARPYWGKGIAPEAAVTIITEAIATLGATRFVAGVFADNPASMRVLEKMGFRKKGSEGQYFSMARLSYMESIGFELCLDGQESSNHLPAAQAEAIYAN